MPGMTMRPIPNRFSPAMGTAIILFAAMISSAQNKAAFPDRLLSSPPIPLVVSTIYGRWERQMVFAIQADGVTVPGVPIPGEAQFKTIPMHDIVAITSPRRYPESDIDTRQFQTLVLLHEERINGIIKEYDPDTETFRVMLAIDPGNMITVPIAKVDKILYRYPRLGYFANASDAPNERVQTRMALATQAASPDWMVNREEDVVLKTDGSVVTGELNSMSFNKVEFLVDNETVTIHRRDIIAMGMFRLNEPDAFRLDQTVTVMLADTKQETTLHIKLINPDEKEIANKNELSIYGEWGGHVVHFPLRYVQALKNNSAGMIRLTELKMAHSEYRPRVYSPGLPQVFVPRVNRTVFGHVLSSESEDVPGRENVICGLAGKQVGMSLITPNTESSGELTALKDFVSMRSVSTVSWTIPDNAERFMTSIMICPDVVLPGKARYEVQLDHEIIVSGELKSMFDRVPVDIDVTGRSLLSFHVSCGSDGDRGDHVLFNNARFILKKR